MQTNVKLTMEDVNTLVPTLKAHLNVPVMKVLLASDLAALVRIMANLPVVVC